MKVEISGFRTKNQQRMRFVQVLQQYNLDIGLKDAKILQDKMLDGEPILYTISEDKLNEFLSELTRLDIIFRPLT